MHSSDKKVPKATFGRSLEDAFEEADVTPREPRKEAKETQEASFLGVGHVPGK